MRLMELGLIDAAIVGGIDSLCKMTLHGFRGLGILSDTHCKPFASDRAGINIGEGAGLMLLERDARQTRAEALAYLLGWASRPTRTTCPRPSPRAAAPRRRCSARSRWAGKLARSDVGLLIAHGTATPQNDVAESMAIEGVLGNVGQGDLDQGLHRPPARRGRRDVSAVFAAHAVRTNRIPRSLGAEPKSIRRSA
jgi:3-oxoacyl-[acyl-carrier-protein] synthase-1